MRRHTHRISISAIAVAALLAQLMGTTSITALSERKSALRFLRPIYFSSLRGQQIYVSGIPVPGTTHATFLILSPHASPFALPKLAPHRVPASQSEASLFLQNWNYAPNPAPVGTGQPYPFGPPWTNNVCACRLVTDRDGDRIAFWDGVGNLRIVSPTLTPVATFPAEAKSPRGGRVEDIAISADGKEVFSLIYRKRAPEVRAYDIAARREIWRRRFGAGIPQHVTVSPSGRRIAWTRLEPATTAGGAGYFRQFSGANLIIEDAATGRVLNKIATGDAAGWVCFGDNGRVFTAPEFLPRPTGPIPNFDRTKVKAWNAKSGRLTATFRDPGRGVHDSITLSPDGRILYGNVSKPTSFDWLDARRSLQPADCVIAAWDATTGRLLATSANLNHGRRHYYSIALSAAQGGVLISDSASPALLRIERAR